MFMLAIKALCFLNGQDDTLHHSVFQLYSCPPLMHSYTQHCVHDRKLHTEPLRALLITDDFKNIFL